MIKTKSYKFRLYPSSQQRGLLAKHFGSMRFVYNHYLSERQSFYLKNKESLESERVKSSLNYYDNCKDLTKLKKKDGYVWLKEVNSQSLQSSLKHLEMAYRRFFKFKKGFPKYKSKYGKQSFCVPQHLKILNKRIYFTKFQDGIRVKQHRDIVGRIVTSTISKNSSGQYYISISTEQEITSLPKLKNAVGIDLGLTVLATCSDGEVYKNPKSYNRYEYRLKYLQKQFSKKKKGSRNRIKSKLKVAKTHQKIKNIRHNYLHKVSTELIDKNQAIILEDLSVKNMMSNRHLSKSIGDVGWSIFVSMLEYKSDWYGREVIKIDRWFPSSKMCSSCNHINQNLKLNHRSWECPNCGIKLDRELNASINIYNQGINKSGRYYRSKLVELPVITRSVEARNPPLGRGSSHKFVLHECEDKYKSLTEYITGLIVKEKKRKDANK